MTAWARGALSQRRRLPPRRGPCLDRSRRDSKPHWRLTILTYRLVAIDRIVRRQCCLDRVIPSLQYEWLVAIDVVRERPSSYGASKRQPHLGVEAIVDACVNARDRGFLGQRVKPLALGREARA